MDSSSISLQHQKRQQLVAFSLNLITTSVINKCSFLRNARGLENIWSIKFKEYRRFLIFKLPLKSVQDRHSYKLFTTRIAYLLNQNDIIIARKKENQKSDAKLKQKMKYSEKVKKHQEQKKRKNGSGFFICALKKE
jgi:hypothetical protein